MHQIQVKYIMIRGETNVKFPNQLLKILL